MSEIYTLLVEVSKSKGDDLPDEAVGAVFLCFAPADGEEEAVREAVKLFREAGMNPLEVTNYGTTREREADGYEPTEEEIALAREALDTNSIIILDKQLVFAEDTGGWVN